MALLQQRVAIITGAGNGIGRGVAHAFAREGAAVVIAEIDEVSGPAVERELKELGARALFVKTDVTNRASIEATVQTAIERFGSLDILVNNAFIPTPNVLLEDKTDEMLQMTLTSALWATWWAMRAAMPHMRERRWGRIVNFYSIDTETGAW